GGLPLSAQIKPKTGAVSDQTSLDMSTRLLHRDILKCIVSDDVVWSMWPSTALNLIHTCRTLFQQSSMKMRETLYQSRYLRHRMCRFWRNRMCMMRDNYAGIGRDEDWFNFESM